MHVPSAVRLTVAREIKCFELKHVTAARRVRSAHVISMLIYREQIQNTFGRFAHARASGNQLGVSRQGKAGKTKEKETLSVSHGGLSRPCRTKDVADCFDGVAGRKYYANDSSCEPLDLPRLQSRETSVAFFYSAQSILETGNRAVIVAVISLVPRNPFNLSSRSQCQIRRRFRERDASP
jgi:hypothetical protein